MIIKSNSVAKLITLNLPDSEQLAVLNSVFVFLYKAWSSFLHGHHFLFDLIITLIFGGEWCLMDVHYSLAKHWAWATCDKHCIYLNFLSYTKDYNFLFTTFVYEMQTGIQMTGVYISPIFTIQIWYSDFENAQLLTWILSELKDNHLVLSLAVLCYLLIPASSQLIYSNFIFRKIHGVGIPCYLDCIYCLDAYPRVGASSSL